MFIIAQIPFVDFRLLSNIKYEDCIFPNTFSKKNNKSTYYRYFGEEKNRFSPNQLPPFERQYYNSHKILRINENSFIGNGMYIPTLLFSRLFEEVQFFHFDIGIREKIKNDLGKRELYKFIKQFLLSPFFSFNSSFDKNLTSYNFIELGEQIKKVYLYATKVKRIEEQKDYSSEITLGYPSLFIIYNKEETVFFENAKEIKLDNGIKVLHDLIPIKNNLVNLWFIGKNTLPKYNQDLRNLRIFLSKLHSYKESTRIILNHLNYNDNKDIDMSKIVVFFEYILSHIERERYYGYNNADFWRIVFDVDYTYNGISWDEYKLRIHAKIKEIKMSSNNNITINGNIDNFFNDLKDVHISITNTQNQMESCIKDFDSKFEELIANSQLTNSQIELLNENIDEFKTYVAEESPKKEKASNLLDIVSDTFKKLIKNSDSIQQLILSGKAIINLLK